MLFLLSFSLFLAPSTAIFFDVADLSLVSSNTSLSLSPASSAATFVDVAESVQVLAAPTVGFQRVVLSAPVMLQRGDFIVVTGPLGRRYLLLLFGSDGGISWFYSLTKPEAPESQSTVSHHRCVNCGLSLFMCTAIFTFSGVL